jgi:hypothetical protein
MNKLTSDQQILGHFVRIRTILRWSRKAVKRRCIRKSRLPIKNAGRPVPLFINWAGRTLLRDGAFAGFLLEYRRRSNGESPAHHPIASNENC